MPSDSIATHRDCATSGHLYAREWYRCVSCGHRSLHADHSAAITAAPAAAPDGEGEPEECLARMVEIAREALAGNEFYTERPALWITTVDCHAAVVRDELTALRSRITEGDAERAKLAAERDEADRCAGAAERRLAEQVEANGKRLRWLRDAKADAGYHPDTSFDVVWRDMLAARARLSTLEGENARLRRRVELAERARDRHLPCPDHRDKVREGECQVCRAERAESRRADPPGGAR